MRSDAGPPADLCRAGRLEVLTFGWTDVDNDPPPIGVSVQAVGTSGRSTEADIGTLIARGDPNERLTVHFGGTKLAGAL